MNFLRDVYHRSALYQYFADLEPIDRVTFWVVVALSLALGFASNAIVHSHASAMPEPPRLTAPPFSMDFAGAGLRSPA